MDKKTLIAILISLAIWAAWQKLYWEPYQIKRDAWERLVKNNQTEASATSSAAQKSRVEPGVKKGPSTTVIKSRTKLAYQKEKLSLKETQLSLSSGPEFFQDWELKNFSTGKETAAKEKINFEYVTGFSQQIKFGILGEDFVELEHRAWEKIPTKSALYKDKLEATSFNLERTIYKGDTPHTVNLNYTVEFKKIIPSHVFISLYGRKNRKNDEPGGLLSGYPDLLQVSYLNIEGKESFQANDLKENVSSNAGAKWLSINTKYFLLALIPKEKELRHEYGVKIENINFNNVPAVKGSLLIPTHGKKSLSIPLTVFFGPKQIEYLEAVEKNSA